MGDDVTEKLRELMDTQGQQIFHDPNKFTAIMHDFCPGSNEPEIDILAAAIRKNIPQHLQSCGNALTVDLRGKLSQRLTEVGLRTDTANWAVCTWATALGMVIVEEPKEPVEPEKSMQPDEPEKPDPQPSNITKIAILGSGDMGYGIGEVAAMAGYKVKFYDIKQEFIDRGMGKVLDSFAQQVSRQKITQESMNKALGNMSGYTNLKDALKDIDYMIEAVPEIMEIKLKVLRECDEYAPKHAILASNTSNMSITKIASATNRPDKVVGLHFFNPVPMMTLVEVVRGEKTSDETMDASYELVKTWRNFRGAMVPLRVEKDTPSFVYNRMGAPAGLYMSVLLEKGVVTAEGADAKVRSIGAPMGPFETFDFVGLDVMFHSQEYLASVLSPEYKPANWLERKMKAGELGRKTGKGIFDWPGGARPAIDVAKADPNFDPMDIICLQVNEGTKLIEAGVVKTPAEIDMAMVHGGGGMFGPFALAKGLGWARVAEKCEAIAKKTGINLFMPTETLKKGNIKL